MYAKDRTTAVAIRQECAQVVVIFPGLHNNVHGMSALAFLKGSGLSNRNLILLRDLRQSAYRRGLSDEVPSRAALVAHLDEHLSQMPHVRQRLFVGVSAGAEAAILLGARLGANDVYAFGTRCPTERWMAGSLGYAPRRRVARTVQQIRRRLPAKGRMGQRISGVLDLSALRQVEEAIRTAPVSTRYNLYYSPRNRADCLVHDALVGLPGVVSHAVSAPSTWDEGQTHNVVAALHELGRLAEPFPDFEAAQEPLPARGRYA